MLTEISSNPVETSTPPNDQVVLAITISIQDEDFQELGQINLDEAVQKLGSLRFPNLESTEIKEKVGLA